MSSKQKKEVNMYRKMMRKSENEIVALLPSHDESKEIRIGQFMMPLTLGGLNSKNSVVSTVAFHIFLRKNVQL